MILLSVLRAGSWGFSRVSLNSIPVSYLLPIFGLFTNLLIDIFVLFLNSLGALHFCFGWVFFSGSCLRIQITQKLTLLNLATFSHWLSNHIYYWWWELSVPSCTSGVGTWTLRTIFLMDYRWLSAQQNTLPGF